MALEAFQETADSRQIHEIMGGLKRYAFERSMYDKNCFAAVFSDKIALGAVGGPCGSVSPENASVREIQRGYLLHRAAPKTWSEKKKRARNKVRIPV